MPRRLSVGPQVVSLAGVVVDDVEDHLDPGGVQRLDHRLELGDLPARSLLARVALLGREVAERAVAPVVAQRLVLDEPVVGELVHRQQLDRGHAQVGEVLDGRRVRQPGVGAAQLLGDVGVQLGEARARASRR